MNTSVSSLPLPQHGRRSWFDWAFALIVLGGAGWFYQAHGKAMDGYEIGILALAVPSLIWLGWFWAPLRVLMLSAGLASAGAMALYMRTTDAYGADLSQGDKVFWLKYFLSSQSAILWMSVLFYMSTLFYWGGVFARSGNATRLGSRLAWAGVFMALDLFLFYFFFELMLIPFFFLAVGWGTDPPGSDKVRAVTRMVVYTLVGSLFASDARGWPVRGLSGDLSLDDQGRVHRTLPLAQFRNGRPAPIDPPPAMGKPSSNFLGQR